jgi:hypothetical protein
VIKFRGRTRFRNVVSAKDCDQLERIIAGSAIAAFCAWIIIVVRLSCFTFPAQTHFQLFSNPFRTVQRGSTSASDYTTTNTSSCCVRSLGSALCSSPSSDFRLPSNTGLNTVFFREAHRTRFGLSGDRRPGNDSCSSKWEFVWRFCWQWDPFCVFTCT